MASSLNEQPEEIDGNGQILNPQNLDYTEYLDMPVFTQRTVITMQPNRDVNQNRRAIPISTLDWGSTSQSHIIPTSGLDFLQNVSVVNVQQTVELIDLLAYVESENRFQVKVPGAETLYIAAESSSKAQRLCCASSRGFEMKLFDQSHQEAIRLIRRLACSNWIFGCCLQELQVFSDVDRYTGSVIQEWSMSAPSFMLTNSSDTIMFRLVGPKSASACCGTNYQAKFELLNPECTSSEGSIVHTWDNLTSDYSLIVTFPTTEVTTEMKAVILGAAFLLEYMFFETSKRTVTCGVC